MNNSNKQRADIETPVYGSQKMRTSAPTEKIPMQPTAPEIAYQMVKDETFPQTPAATEPRHIRNDLHGRLRHQVDERIDRRELHRRNGISARSRHGRPLRQHHGQPVEFARTGAVESRRAGDRLVRSLYAGRRSRMAALACETQSAGQTVRQTELRHFDRFPGRMGKIRSVVANRNAYRAPEPGKNDARSERRAGHVR